jgi:xanthine/CO dehydrogenase XdhC/CoxF family maturation factor
MVKGIVASVVGLGLIGGVGAVTYADDGTATVSIDERNTPNDASDDARVTLKTGGGKEYLCPADIDEKFEPGDIEAGRIKLTLERVGKRIDAIETANPGDTLPPKVYDEYQRLLKRQNALVKHFNEAVDRHNAILEANCT